MSVETSTATDRVHEPLGFGGALRNQLRFLSMSRRPLLMLVALLGVLFLGGEPWSRSYLARFFDVWPVWLMLAGPFWGFTVFHNEGPSDRLYHWSQPVGRTAQTLARLTAGLLWLWLLLAVLAVVGLLVALSDGNASQFAYMTAAGWLDYFLGPMIGYLLISVLTVASDHPLRWFFGLLFLLPITVTLLTKWLDFETVVQQVLSPLSNPRWGLGATMVAAFSDGVLAINTAVVPSFQYKGPAFDPAAWWVALPLWILVLGLIVAGLAARHPDRFPRLHFPGRG